MDAKRHARKMLVKRNHPSLFSEQPVKPEKGKQAAKTSEIKTESSTVEPVKEEAVVEQKPVAKKRATKKDTEVTDDSIC